jgi:creatinine amidohydrolase
LAVTSATSRLLEEMTWVEVREAADRGAGVLLPVGSTEQHGPHLPLATDALLARDLALAAAAELDFIVAPTIAYGYRSRPLSGGGPGFQGTTAVRGTTLMAVVEDVLGQLIDDGFERLAVVNWHYENQNFVYEAAHLALEAKEQWRRAKVLVTELPFGDLSADTMQLLFGDEFPGWDVEHAGIMETSLMMLLHPDLVHMERAVDDQSERHPWYDVLPVPSDFVPESGCLWRPTQATVEKGEAAWREVVAAMVAALNTDLSTTVDSQRYKD